MKGYLAGVFTVLIFLGLQGEISKRDEAVMQASLDNSISSAIMQCLPEEIDEVCTIKLVDDSGEVKLVTERHAMKHYGQPPVRQPSVKFVVAMGERND